MATSIPPHNLGEVIDAVKAYMLNNEITTKELMRYLKGPDFPTGGIVINKDELEDIMRPEPARSSCGAKWNSRRENLERPM